MAKEWAKPFYNSKAWEDCRISYIESVHGLCERCLKRGKVKPGKIVHHTCYLNPTNINDPDISLNFKYLEYLCQDCHNEEHHGSKVLRDGLYFDDDGNIISR